MSVENIKDLDFTVVGADQRQSEAINSPSISFFKDAMRRLSKNKIAMVFLVLLVLVILGAIIFPAISEFSISDQNTAESYKPFMYRDTAGKLHIFGTDVLGRDMWVRIWDGARISLFIAFTAVLINFVVGALYGGISGYFGGWVDNLMMRIVELIIGIPYLIIVILLMMIMKPGITTIIVAYSAVGWTGMARLVRGQVMQLKEQEFILAAKVMGGSPFRIILRHLLPNTLSVMMVNITLAIPSAIFTEAFLSFIGLGVPIPQASWGTLASDGAAVFMQYPHILIIPAVLISVTMLAFNLLGDALRDSFDPKLRR